MNDWERYDCWVEDEPEHDPEGEELRQNELDDSLWGLAQSISRLQGRMLAKRQAD